MLSIVEDIQHMGLADFSAEEIANIWMNLSPEQQIELESLIKVAPPRALMPHQVVPVAQTWWEVYLLVGGRGVGKTVAGATETRNHLRRLGKDARVGIGAPTNADVRDTCMEGETGLIAMFPDEFVYYNRSLMEARHIYGGYVKAIGMEQPKRWNGPQWSMLWIDELALCNQDSYDQAAFGLRLGERPYAVCTTTPKNKKWVKKLAMEPTTYVPQYIAEDGVSKRLPTTFDNLYLPGRRVDWLKRKYEGSRLGLQELSGVFIEDIEGAMWKRKWIMYKTDKSTWPRFVRKVVAIDPAGSVSRKTADENSLSEEQKLNKAKNADTAIAVVGVGEDGRMYVLHIESGQWTPSEWAKKAIQCFHKFRCDNIIAERNYGGDMVESNIRNHKQFDPELNRVLNGRYLPIKVVVASKGKELRAQPVAALYEQRRVYHCAAFGPAEDQMCSFVDTNENEGADMVDALVWAITELAELGIEVVDSIVIAGPQDPRYVGVTSNLTKPQNSFIIRQAGFQRSATFGAKHGFVGI